MSHILASSHPILLPCFLVLDDFSSPIAFSFFPYFLLHQLPFHFKFLMFLLTSLFTFYIYVASQLLATLHDRINFDNFWVLLVTFLALWHSSSPGSSGNFHALCCIVSSILLYLFFIFCLLFLSDLLFVLFHSVFFVPFKGMITYLFYRLRASYNDYTVLLINGTNNNCIPFTVVLYTLAIMCKITLSHVHNHVLKVWHAPHLLSKCHNYFVEEMKDQS